MKISIITVTHNSVSVIDKCLNSVKNQKYKNIEHIIIDGASNDGTLSLLNSKCEQFSILISEPDKGVYDAMNKGIKLATGDVVGFLNSDDFYENNDVLSDIAKVFEQDPLLDACYADIVYTDKHDTNKIIRYWKSEQFKLGSFSKGWSPPHPTFFVRNSVYKKYGKFNLCYQIASDWELMMRFLEVKKIKVKYIPKLWVKMRLGGISNKNLKNIIKQNKENLNALEKYNLKKNTISFIIHKIFLRIKQFISRSNI